MLITENVLRKIIAEEYQKLINEGGIHGPLSTQLGLYRAGDETLQYSDTLSLLDSENNGKIEKGSTMRRLYYFLDPWGDRESTDEEKQKIALEKIENGKEKLEQIFGQLEVRLRSDHSKTEKLKRQIVSMIHEL